MIKEYIFVLENGEVFKVHTVDNEDPKDKLMDICKKFSDKEIWQERLKILEIGEYTEIENFDYMGITQITN